MGPRRRRAELTAELVDPDEHQPGVREELARPGRRMRSPMELDESIQPCNVLRVRTARASPRANSCLLSSAASIACTLSECR